MSERNPTIKEAAAGIWVWNGKRASFSKWAENFQGWCWEGNTHWMPADIPAPPKEETQRERDDTAFYLWYKDYWSDNASLREWHAALAYERAEVLKLLTDFCVEHDQRKAWIYYDAMKQLRARCAPRP